MEFGRGSQWAVGRGHLLTFTARGNLELWKTPELSLVWESGTSGKGAKLIMQGDGNFVIYDDDDESVWASGTFGHERALLSVEDDGRLVIYSADLSQTLWDSSATEHDAADDEEVGADEPA